MDSVRAWPDFVHPDASGDKVLTRDGGIRLRDGETGTLLATLVEGPTVSPGPHFGTRAAHGVFLADGRIVVGQAVGSRTVMHVFSPDGAPLDKLDLDRAPAGLAVGPEVAPGRVSVRFGSSLAGPETLVVDLAARAVVDTIEGYPLRDFWGLGVPRATSTSVHFFIAPRDGAIVRRDFATGGERVVAGPGAPRGQRLTLH